jgi:hypothetical protein
MKTNDEFIIADALLKHLEGLFFLDEKMMKDLAAVRSNNLKTHDSKLRRDVRDRLLQTITSLNLTAYDIRGMFVAPVTSPSTSYCIACVDGIAAPCKMPEEGCPESCNYIDTIDVWRINPEDPKYDTELRNQTAADVMRLLRENWRLEQVL